MSSVSSIREALPIIGRTILEITTDDWEDVKAKYMDYMDHEDPHSRIYLHLDDGTTVSFAIGDGNKAFTYDGYPKDHPFSGAD